MLQLGAETVENFPLLRRVEVLAGSIHGGHQSSWAQEYLLVITCSKKDIIPFPVNHVFALLDLGIPAGIVKLL
ncbi:hypothetical protein D3C85_1680790 [compost metagenome]